MTARILRSASALLVAASAFSSPLLGQLSVGSGAEFLGYSFDDGLGADAAQLFLVPVAVRIPIASILSLDFYTAWAEGRVEQGNTQFKLSGLVDTQVQATVQATPFALITLGANLPTGNPTHSSQEAVVASVLSTDLLGFREATFGAGTAFTSSLATAVRAGGFGLGIAGAYSMRGEFEPTEGDDLTYQPGSETRVRVGLDRNFGNSTFTAGGTFITYTSDQADGSNLFQAGNRLRFDASFAFRAGAGVWTLYAADLIRSNGDLTLQIVDAFGAVGQDQVATAKQNLLVAGIVGTVGLGRGFVFRPQVDFKLQSRREPDGSDPGSGWILATGTDIPMRLFGVEFFPKARILFGSIKNETGTSIPLLGMEFKGTLRLTF